MALSYEMEVAFLIEKGWCEKSSSPALFMGLATCSDTARLLHDLNKNNGDLNKVKANGKPINLDSCNIAWAEVLGDYKTYSEIYNVVKRTAPNSFEITIAQMKDVARQLGYPYGWIIPPIRTHIVFNEALPAISIKKDFLAKHAAGLWCEVADGWLLEVLGETYDIDGWDDDLWIFIKQEDLQTQILLKEKYPLFKEILDEICAFSGSCDIDNFVISRADLVGLAEKLGEQPRFLFSDNDLVSEPESKLSNRINIADGLDESVTNRLQVMIDAAEHFWGKNGVADSNTLNKTIAAWIEDCSTVSFTVSEQMARIIRPDYAKSKTWADNRKPNQG